MKLRKQDQEFRNPRIFYADPKNVDLDRVLVVLFLWLKTNGMRPATTGRQKKEFEKVDVHFKRLAGLPGVSGFKENEEIARQWLETDVFDLVNRGRPTEAIASLRPLHLDAHKIRVAKYCRDYNFADALYAMLEHGEGTAHKELKAYLEQGRSYQPGARLDLETLAVLKLVEGVNDTHPSGEKITEHPPLCRGQARVLCDDIERILSYKDVPRPVMIDYLRTILGLHLGIYTLRLGRQLSGWIKDCGSHPSCRSCPVYGNKEDPFAECPYPVTFTTDMGGDYQSRMAQLAQEDAASEYARLGDLVKAVFSMNQLLRYAREEHITDDPYEVPKLLANPSPEFEADFKAVLKQIRNLGEEDESVPPEVQAILDSGLPSFETLIELVTHVRQAHHLKYLVQMIDKLFQKNSPFGAMVQGKSRANPRRWHLGGRALEVLVQLAVLKAKDTPDGRQFETEPILIEDFLTWVERRYGFVIAPGVTPAGRKPVSLDEHRAFRENVRAFKDRLREIGFYDDLSDAYNAQTIRPRYELAGRVEWSSVKPTAKRNDGAAITPAVILPRLVSRAEDSGCITQTAFESMVLVGLLLLGGYGGADEVRSLVQSNVPLAPPDLEVLGDGRDLRWTNKVRFARANLVRDGLLLGRSASGHGLWELSPRGLARAQQLLDGLTGGQEC